MSINKISSSHKNGFINILFNESQTIEPQQAKGKDEYHFHKFIEEHVFIPRNKVKHIRILKINDTIYTNFNTLKADHIKRMFVDGSHVRELTPNRQIATQDDIRKRYNRAGSPESFRKRNDSTKRNLSYYEEKLDQKEKNEEETKDQKLQGSSNEVMIMSMQEKSFEESTTSSSNRNIRISFRSRKSEKKKEAQPTKQLSLQLKKQLFRFYSNPPCSPENISAKAYIIYEHKISKYNQKYSSQCLHAAFNTKINLEIASLTKIMTCLVVLEICDRFKIDICSTSLPIDHFFTKVEGTSAELEAQETYTIEQLLYGLMLPSGNDASLALSAYCGQLLEKNKRGEDGSEQLNKKHYCRKFVMQMNKKSNELGMKRTIYSNSHGLPNILNKSCASDLVILINSALHNAQFRKIVSCRTYQAFIVKRESSGKVETRAIRWENTHKLVLSKPETYLGIKTGTTEAAGPCLASLVLAGGRQFIIIVLNSRSSKWRYKDTEQLREWLCAKQKL